MNDCFENYSDVISIDDLMKMLHIGRNVAYQLLRDGKIKTVKVGKKYIIPKKSVISFIDTAC